MIRRLPSLSILILLAIPVAALASDVSDPVGGLLSLVTDNPRVSAFLGIVTVIQHAAPFLALVPAIWGGNTATTGAGSGWSRFWRRVEAFPQIGK